MHRTRRLGHLGLDLGPLFALCDRAAAGQLTLAEMAALLWHCLAGPAGLPPEVVDKIAAVGKDIVADPEARKAFQAAGLEMSLLAGSAFGELIRADLKKVAEIRSRARIQID